MKILLILLIFSNCEASSLIEKNDQKILKRFFKTSLTRESLGYVLLGEKPAYLFGYVDSLSWLHPIDSLCGLRPYYNKGNQFKKKAWETLRKYSSSISDRFVVLEEATSNCPYCNNILIIHRELFCKVVNENRDVFETILNRTITGEKLLDEAKHQPLFSVLLKKNEALLGIILGFGRNNSWQFSREETIKTLGMFPKEEDKITTINLPIFRADWNDPETIQLRERYLICREQIRTSFLEHDFFEEILKILFK